MQAKTKHASRSNRSKAPIPIHELFPKGSCLDDIVRITAANTDLPPTATLFSAYSYVAAALAQAGLTVDPGTANVVSPNLPLVIILGDDTTPDCIFREVVRRIFREPIPAELPVAMTVASLFGHSSAVRFEVPVDAAGTKELRCLSLIRSSEAQHWLKGLHSQPNLGKLLRQIIDALSGGQLHRWTKDGGDEYSAAMHLSLLFTCRQSSFFATTGGLFFSSPLIERLLVVLAHDRPEHRMPMYTDAGISTASDSWSTTWQAILAGPQRYVTSDGAKRVFCDWWLSRLKEHRDDERDLRRVDQAVWKYALVVQALIDPCGTVSEEATRYAVRIADRHLADLDTSTNVLASENDAERIARKVADYIEEYPDAARGAIMQCVRGAQDPAVLNASLTRIAEMHVNEWVRERALELRAASRSRHERPVSNGGENS
jgi:hypothetical protein